MTHGPSPEPAPGLPARTLAAEQLGLLASALQRSAMFALLTDAQLRVVWANDAWRAVPGIDAMLGQPWLTWLTSAGDAAPAAEVAQAVAACRPFATQVLMVLPDGRPWWRRVEATPMSGADGRFAGYLAIAGDITALKLAEDAERLAAFRYRRVMESTHDGIWERDLRTNVSWYSPRFKEIMGFADHELPNDRTVMNARIHPEDMEAFLRPYDEAMRNGGQWRYQTRVLHRNGTYRWLRGRARAWPDEHGKPAILVGAVTDVTEEMQAVEALRAHQSQLEDAVRERTARLEAARAEAERANRSKSLFLANMSHEIRTPLNGVMGMTDLALRAATTDTQRRYLELARSSGATLMAIINDILDVAKAEAGKLTLDPQEIDLGELLTLTAREMLPLAHDRGLQMHFDYRGEVQHVVGDATRIRQIVGNLLSNAIRFTPAGRVQFAVTTQLTGPDRCLVTLEVTDTGIGMDDATAHRVFLPFEQGDASVSRSAGGTGLGLSIVRSLCELMGGRVTVTSREGLGSTFRVVLPLPVAAPEVPEAAGQEHAGGAVAWLISGVPGELDTLAQRLHRLGWRTEVLRSARSARDRLRHGIADDDLPALIMVVEGQATEEDDWHALRSAAPQQAEVVLVVDARSSATSNSLRNGDAGTKIYVAPFSPRDLTQLTRTRRLRTSEPVLPLRPAPLSQAPGQRFLIVEDNPVNQLLAGEMLRMLGFDVVVADNGQAALEQCRHDPPDAVLMDVQMPGMDGLEATRQLRQLQQAGRLPAFPIIAATAHASESDRRACLAAGMDGYIAKPLDLRAMRTEIRRVLRARAGDDEDTPETRY